MELSRKIEETGIKDKVKTHTSEIMNKGLEIGAEVYHKTTDKIEQINVCKNIFKNFYVYDKYFIGESNY